MVGIMTGVGVDGRVVEDVSFPLPIIRRTFVRDTATTSSEKTARTVRSVHEYE